MGPGQMSSYDWRARTVELACRLERAHAAVEDLGSALEHGNEASVRSIARGAFEAVGSAAEAADTFRAERPPEARMTGPDATGSMLAIGGSEAAAGALDVMVHAMVALAATEDGDDEDFLIGACVDAARAYEVGTGVLGAVPARSGPAILDLDRAFQGQDEVALRRRLTSDRARVSEITRRVGTPF